MKMNYIASVINKLSKDKIKRYKLSVTSKMNEF